MELTFNQHFQSKFLESYQIVVIKLILSALDKIEKFKINQKWSILVEKIKSTCSIGFDFFDLLFENWSKSIDFNLKKR